MLGASNIRITESQDEGHLVDVVDNPVQVPQLRSVNLKKFDSTFLIHNSNIKLWPPFSEGLLLPFNDWQVVDLKPEMSETKVEEWS